METQRNCLVTGGTSGIGAAICRRILADAGEEDRVYINYGHDHRQAAGFLASLSDRDREKVTLLPADLSTYEGMCAMTCELRTLADHLDWLVCNTGISTKEPFSKLPFGTWQSILDTNLSIPAYLVRDLRDFILPGGSVLFIGSYAGRQAYSSSLPYGVSKAAVHFLASALVKELEPYKIRVNAVAPGFIETPWHADRSEESRERINSKIALHRFGTTQEVAELVWAVLRNGYMNGSVVDIHGGYDYL